MSSFVPTRLLVTGGAGFIGSAVVRSVLAHAEPAKVVVLDALTYAGHRVNLAECENDARFEFVHGDICDRALVEDLFTKHAFDAVLHLAAESHVDRSIESAEVFVRTNVNGTFSLLDAARRAWDGREANARFVHVSTDEVYGALGETGVFTETTPYAPNSPYAASKAASDLLVRSFHQTYKLPAIVTNCCNNYGPRQLPEKLIPLMIVHAAEDKPLPVYGEGKQVREWLHVDDHAAGLWLALTRGAPGQSYLFGSGEERNNKAMVELIADAVDEHLGREPGTSRALMTYVPDRKGHDFRYAIDASKAERDLGWKPSKQLAAQLRETVRWYLTNADWRREVATEEHARFQVAYYGKKS
ncbi:MAG: dTDP-glucose 4,6-dehydratase [Labilithrix sp.]|nr:dTDP-glucose 4,6-dehydratase [Labilithrix sp.]MCW5810793.1 dTDP-glucose 4,6-dehydratase [Labilithrix sp.]